MRSKHAKWTPLNFLDKLEKRQDSDVNVIDLHTNGGGSHLVGWFDEEYRQTHERIGCHFQFYKDGSVDQLVDTDSIIYAEYDLSRRAVSFETEDDGHPDTPWTPPQINSMLEVIRELMGHHTKIMPHLMANPHDSGIGYHQLFHVYNQLLHNCPGPIRVAQVHHTILPALGNRPPSPKPGTHYPAPKGSLPLPWGKHDPDTATWQQRMVARGWHDIGRIDGIYGSKCESVCRRFQAQISRQGFTPHLHGRVDAVTWRASWLAPVT